MINIEEIFPSDINKYDAIDPFTFKYTKLSLKNNFILTFNINIDSYKYSIKFLTMKNQKFVIYVKNLIIIIYIYVVIYVMNGFVILVVNYTKKKIQYTLKI